NALLGRVEEAERWMAEVEKRGGFESNLRFPAMKAFARAVVDCRSGRTAEAVKALDERWTEYEAVLSGETLRPMRVVRAFAIAASGPRSAGMAEAALANTREAYPGEYRCLTVA